MFKIIEVTQVIVSGQFFSQHTITRHGYNGGGYDGPNSKKILGLLDEMAKIIQVDFQPCILVLRKFKQGRIN